MRILVIGEGGREDALGWALARSPGHQLWFYPGNAGTRRWGENIAPDALQILPGRCPPTSASDAPLPVVEAIPALTSWAQTHQMDLVVIGPEAYLAGGLAELLRPRGIATFGPGQAGAQLEASKAWAKEFMTRYRVPTAQHRTFTRNEQAAAIDFIRASARPWVVKADGLAAGKGVTVCQTVGETMAAVEQLLQARTLGTAGERVVLEEVMHGPEVSLLLITDGTAVAVLPEAQDHKRMGEGDTGPNTGGMGAYSPVPFFTPALRQQVMEEIVWPTLAGLRQEGIDYRGVLYVGLMLTGQDHATPRVVEFNCRWGDPETQVILARVGPVDWVHLLAAAAARRLRPYLEEIYPSSGLPEQADPGRPGFFGASPAELPSWLLPVQSVAALSVVLAAAGYPGPYRHGVPIRGLRQRPVDDSTLLFHGGTRVVNEGNESMAQIVNTGGRVMHVVGTGPTLAVARERAYAGVAAIQYEGKYYRRDIGVQAL